jgi:hypothetical protein
LTLSNTYKGELRGRYQTPIIELLRITHSTAPGELLLADAPYDIISNGETFKKFKFSALTPKESKDYNADLTLTLANIDPTLLCPWFHGSQITEAHVFSLYRVRELSPDTIEEQFLDCPMASWNLDGPIIQVICRWETVLGQPLSRPMDRYHFPGLYRDA